MNRDLNLLESQKKSSSLSDDPKLMDSNRNEKLSNLQNKFIIETNNLDSDSEHHELKRVMKSRHVQMISIGGVIGTGLFLRTAVGFASIKVITIVALIVMGIILDAGGGPNHDPIGFRYWRNPGPFVQYKNVEGALGHFLGFWVVIVQAAFSCIGTEITALTAAEAKNPKKTLPSAIRGVSYRLCVFYILGTFIIGLLVPSNDPRLNLNSQTAASSPFVIAIENCGIKFLPSIINAALLSSAWSAASSDMYTSSRALYALALAGNAPAIFTRTTSWGLPWVAMIVSFLFALVAFMSCGSVGAGRVFGWLASMTSVCGILSWAGIFITYLRFDAGVKAQNIDRNLFPYKSPFRSLGAIYGLAFCCVLSITNAFTVFMKDGWDTPTFIIGYFPIINVFLLYVCSYYYYKRKGLNVAPIPLEELDFVTGARDESRDGIDDFESQSGGLRTFAEKFKTWREG
ncbi:hypothetical protein O181_014117 [Austropuccinia psidii MF-1]|uniref:Amino acid permease/ SLC12A domain-containing protein n=1 Tax=Austropuccinia psidii MF-1 TaxID=1389203 RepID=A0A9Q3GPJ8_9BASI|nr:hypothetical protein [Austropuccinia psidii MF-1]